MSCSCERRFSTGFLLFQCRYWPSNFQIWRFIIILLSVLFIFTHLLEQPSATKKYGFDKKPQEYSFDKYIYCYNKNLNLFNENFFWEFQSLWKSLLILRITIEGLECSMENSCKNHLPKDGYLTIKYAE